METGGGLRALEKQTSLVAKGAALNPDCLGSSSNFSTYNFDLR